MRAQMFDSVHQAQCLWLVERRKVRQRPDLLYRIAGQCSWP